jgi:hypothetical protein
MAAMCNIKYMKIDIKSSIIICLFLGTLFYFLSNKNKKTTQHQIASARIPSILIIDKKPLPLPAPKPLVVVPAQNKLGIDSNWKSR